MHLSQVNLRVPPSELPKRPLSAGSAKTDLLLVNPSAGGGLGHEVLSKLQRFADHRNWPIETLVTRSPEDFVAQAQQAASQGRQRLFAVGGDGTFQLLLNAVHHSPQVVISVIPAGGGNDLAAALGLPPDPVKAAGLLLQGEVCQLDAVRVRTAEGNERLYSSGGGVGLDAEAARLASSTYRNRRGRLRYLLSAINALAGFHASETTVTFAGGEPAIRLEKALLACVLNTPSYGAGLALAPDARIDDGKLDLVLLEDLSLWEILTLLPSLALRGKLKTNHVSRHSVNCVRIDTDPPRNFHGDGEILGTTPVEISVVPRACRVLRAPRISSSSDRA